MAPRWSVLALMLLLCCGSSPAIADNSATLTDTSSASVPKDQSLVIWQAGESYDGGSQFDARLDQPVQAWRIGTPLREVFADLTRQTGVGLDFFDPPRDEPRLCVTLYLNPKDPPSLRAVMAQLSWVTGCLFAYTEARAEGRTYRLLWSSLGEGTAESLAAEAVARREQFRAEMETRRDTQREAAAGILAEAKAALSLSQEEAVARYRGVDDALLLNLLDPSRRAALSFLAGLPESAAKELLEGESGSMSLSWSYLSEDQQAALKQALGDDRQWPTEGEVSISVRTGRGGPGGGRGGRGGDGAFVVTVERERGRRPLGMIPGLLARGEVRGRQQVELQRYLGEIKTPQQETEAREQQREDRQAAGEARREEFAQRRAEAEADTRTLAPEREAQLAALTLSDIDGSASLWRLQEAVAKATGMNVVSDCFWPPRGGPMGRRGGPPESAGSALEVLSRACLGLGGGFGPGPGFGGPGGEDLGMEWGDAGSFLRFRSRRPDVWRGALLPVEVQKKLDAWLEPVLASESASPEPGAGPLSRDLEKLSWLAGHLDDLQVRLGGAIPYEDPSDPVAERRQGLRRATLQQVAMQLPLLRVTATFTPEQWESVKGDGLRWGSDLTPDQQSGASRMVAGRVPEDRLNDVVLQLGETEARTIQQRDGMERTIPSAPALKIVLDGTVIDQIAFGGWGGRGGGRQGPPGGFPGGPPE